ncbi:MAG: inositol monophosphatase family protein [Myxococcota bacterium]
MPSDRARFVRELATEAGALALQRHHDLGNLEVETKGIQDYVTAADREVEELVAGRISDAYPEDGFIGEETGRRDGAAGHGHWVVDPIDGTANFMRGLPMFTVSIAYVHGGADSEVAAIRDVVQGRSYWAERGGGAFEEDAPLSVSPRDSLDRSAVCMGFWNKEGGDAAFIRALTRLTTTKADIRRVGAATFGLMHTAAGRFDAFFQSRINSWDVAAGILLVREAGGWVSDFYGQGGLLRPAPFLACAPGLVEPLSELLLRRPVED